jgi:DNA-directed RNA polymerase subunit M/transcription elongation factor TFIIS
MEGKPIDPLDPPSMAFRCPRCHDEKPQEEQENNPGPDRWFTCPSCGYRWSVSPIADS